MLNYDVDGRVLFIAASGTPTDEDRRRLLDAIEADPRVPAAALVLLDVRRADARGNPREVEHRTRYFIQKLGPKVGPVCAVIVAPELMHEAVHMQSAGAELGLRIGLFKSEDEARKWLRAYE